MDREELDKRVEEEAERARERWAVDRGALEPWTITEMRPNWIAAVRPLVERLAAAEGRIAELLSPPAGLRAGPWEDAVRAVLLASPTESTLAAAERVSKALEAERAAHADVVRGRGQAENTIVELRARIPHLESIIRAQEDAIRGTEKSRGEAWARVVAAEDERDRQAIARGALEAEIERIRDALGCEPDDVTTSEAARMRGTIAGLRIMLEEESAKSAGLEGELEEQRRTTARYRVQLAEVVGREAALRSALADYRAGLRALARDLLGVEVAGRRVEEVGS